MTSLRDETIPLSNMALHLSYSLADQDFHHTKSLGVWNVSTQLLGHLANCPEVGRLTVFSNQNQHDVPFPANVRVEQHNKAASGRLGRIYWDQWGVYSAAQRSGNSWLFLPKGFASSVRRCPVRLAAYVHDTMHDYYQRHYSDNPLGKEARYFMHSLKATLRQAEIIFTNTEFTRKEVERLAQEWGLSMPPIVCAGIGFNSTVPNHEHDRRRVVVLAGPWPHKCTPLAIERLDRWATTRGFTGGVDWVGALPAQATLPPRADWRHFIRLSPHEYAQVLDRAAVVVYFSSYEGFGMPPVEGTLAGAAAVYSEIPSMKEVMGECGFSFSNQSPQEFELAMDSALTATPARLAAWRDQLRKKHDWSVAAKRIAGTLSELDTQPSARAIARPRVATQSKKVLIFAHTPPPHHGQSYMVQQMLSGLGGNQRTRRAAPPSAHGVACYHVNARLSRHLEDIGEARIGKLFHLSLYCLEAIWCRFRYGVKTLYYIPAPGKQAALLRDWMVMALCRPFYPKLILHWHAAGLATWLDAQPNRLLRNLTHHLLGKADLSISLSRFNLEDARRLAPTHSTIVPNGISDPCPAFDLEVLPRHCARQQARQKLQAGQLLTDVERSACGGDPTEVRILFLAHCTREKGLFDAIEGVRQAQVQIDAKHWPFRLKLSVCGAFLQAHEKVEFQQLCEQPEVQSLVNYVGFVSGDQKDQAFREADVFCFPTYYYAESFGLVVIEAMAYGLPVITTRWRSIPELLAPAYPGLVDPKQPAQIAAALIEFITNAELLDLRRQFLACFTIQKHLEALARAIHQSAPAQKSPTTA